MFKYIKATSRLRMSSHRLAIESGRLARPNRIPVDERKCQECSVLEDEYHFVIECKLFNDLRAKYLPRYFWVRPNMYRLVELLNSDNVNHIRNLGIYTYHALILEQTYCIEIVKNNFPLGNFECHTILIG